MKRFLNYLAIFTIVVCVSSCQQEDLSLVVPEVEAEGAVLSFALRDNSLIESSVATKADETDLEQIVSHVDVLLFEQVTAGESALDPAAVCDKHFAADADDEGAFAVIVPPRTSATWVVVLANASDAVRDELDEVATFADLQLLSEDLSSLYATTGTAYAENLPLYGELYQDVIAASATYTVELERIYSRVEATATATDFVVTSLTLLNGANVGYYVAQSPLPTASASSAITQYSTEGGDLQPLYLYENNGGSTDAPNYTDIVIGGTYTTAENNALQSYLKVRLEYGSDTTLSADVVRNTVYKFIVTEIYENSIGYSTLAEAVLGEYTDAEIALVVGEDAMSDVIVGNGDYYVSFSNSEFVAYAPSGDLSDVTAFTMYYDVSTNSNISNFDDIVKSVTLAEGSTGVTLGTLPTLSAGTALNIPVTLADDAEGTIIVRIGNLVKEIAVSRYQDDTNLATAFAGTDSDYVYAKFVDEAPSWLKIAETDGTPSQQDELYSTGGFELDFELDLYGEASTELYLARNSDEGRVKIYFEQYIISGTPTISTTNLTGKTSISCYGATITSSFAVTSTGDITALDGTTSGMPWMAEYSYDSGATWTTDCPDWISMPTSGTGSLSASTISVAPQTAILTGDLLTAQEALVAATSKGSADAPYDLSTEGGTGTQNTANCYIINSPGTYMLPLVYGNAIKDGEANSAAYTSTASGDDVLSIFVDYNGSDITTPNITNATSAIICWQDSAGLVKDVELSTDKDYLIFTVSAGNIAEGNALVAIRDADDVVIWSWHIWVTNHVLGEGDKNVYYSTSYTDSPDNYTTMMPVNLGWCSAGTKKYGDAERSVQVRIKQAGGETTSGVTYTQNCQTTTSTIIGDSPYYQWGRKDPMLPAIGVYNSSTSKPQSGDLQWTTGGSSTSLNGAIKNPNAMYYGGYTTGWCSSAYCNLWSVNNSSYGTIHISDHIKSVYDPSPVGYIVPSVSAFSGFSDVSGYTDSSWYINYSGSFAYGWNLYCVSGGDTIFFPALGSRNYGDAAIQKVGIYSHNLGATPYDNYRCYYFFFTSSSINIPGSYTNAQGMAVRPVRETKAAAEVE